MQLFGNSQLQGHGQVDSWSQHGLECQYYFQQLIYKQVLPPRTPIQLIIANLFPLAASDCDSLIFACQMNIDDRSFLFISSYIHVATLTINIINVSNKQSLPLTIQIYHGSRLNNVVYCINAGNTYVLQQCDIQLAIDWTPIIIYVALQLYYIQ